MNCPYGKLTCRCYCNGFCTAPYHQSCLPINLKHIKKRYKSDIL
jgi:hypothetical protein